MGTAARWDTTTAIPMRDDALLTLTQWLSPAYPVGAFAWSHGLERAVGRGDVTSAADLRDWLTNVLENGAGRSDAILLCAAHGADDVAAIAELAAALAPSQERRMETLQQGAAFAATTRAVWHIDLPDMAYPVAVGRAAGLVGLPVLPTVQLWLQAFASNLVQAAQRLMPLGQTEGQRILAALAPVCIQIGTEASTASLDDIGSATFAVDTASMQHAAQYSRIFRS
ncbi:MAG: urease accessory protein UreF [Yoonia sp.]|uniref:urease accessory protein UreF n=1 Tax=Yoonia sp. TaxID=2212373 RepID=UPI00273EBCF5|nr:urease accessory protein UreF [Yoonia sp.]MDP5085972.1 urease accessory protein UreF [Yoonia sp.]MDP5361873.1 urease accessory protein UreF [Paracoccaceae bacterium]